MGLNCENKDLLYRNIDVLVHPKNLRRKTQLIRKKKRKKQKKKKKKLSKELCNAAFLIQL